MRGESYWRSLTAPWLQRLGATSGAVGAGGAEQRRGSSGGGGGRPSGSSPFGPREPLRSLRVGDPPLQLSRQSNGRPVEVRRLAEMPAAFLVSGFSTADERDAIVAAAVAAPMRQVPRAEEGDEADERRGCEVAWLSSPLTQPQTAWAARMRDAAALVLPAVDAADGGVPLPDAAPADDLHVVKYAPKGAYGLHLDATYAVPRAVTVLHYINELPPSMRGPGYQGETWLPLATAEQPLEQPAASLEPRAGEARQVQSSPVQSLDLNGEPEAARDKEPHMCSPASDGVLVSPRAGDALVFFSFTDDGDVERRSLHGGRPASGTKWIANQWIRLALEHGGAPEEVPKGPGFGPRVVS